MANEVLSIPALVIGAVVCAYWVRVIQMAIKARRKTGRGANFVPRERLGRAIRVVWYPAVAVWTAGPFVVAFARQPLAGWGPVYLTPWVTVPAAAVAVLAFAATWVCWKRMGKSWRMGIDPQEKTQLVFTGPYAYVRHPIYALSSVLMVASVAAAPSVAMMAAGALHLVFLQWEARREERYLVKLHGPAYANYRAKVGRFLPRSLAGYSPGR